MSPAPGRGASPCAVRPCVIRSPILSPRRLAHRTFRLLCLLASLTGCTYWQTVTTPLPELTRGESAPALLRVTTVYDEVFELSDPRVHNDTLIGGALPEEIWTYIALSDITNVAVKKKSALRTAGAVILAVGLAWAIVELCADPDACTSEDIEE